MEETTTKNILFFYFLIRLFELAMHFFFLSSYCDPHFEFFVFVGCIFIFCPRLQFQSETKRKEKKMDIEKDLLDGFSSWTTIICGGISLSFLFISSYLFSNIFLAVTLKPWWRVAWSVFKCKKMRKKIWEQTL